MFARVQDTKDQRYRYRVIQGERRFSLRLPWSFQRDLGRGQTRHVPPRTTRSRLTGRGKSYYQFASAYAERLCSSHAGIAEVMDEALAEFRGAIPRS